MGIDTAATAHFDTVEDTIEAFRSGAFIIVLDSPSRENEGDLMIAAEALTAEKCAFMVRHTSGYICAPMPASRAAHLALPRMVAPTTDLEDTAYTVSVDASIGGLTTGISAADRALTCRLLASAGATADQLTRPGHILPLIARDGGVRERRGHTEAAVEFCRLAGRGEVGVLCELVDDGLPARGHGKTERIGAGVLSRDGCLAFAAEWGLRCCTIESLVVYLNEQERGGK